jgi:hypothetical protein
MRSESELFILSLVARRDWITTEEVKGSLIEALNNRDRSRPLRFGLQDRITEMLMGFAAYGWVEARLTRDGPDQGEWKLSPVGRQVLDRAPADLYERLGFSPAVSKP